MPQNEHCRELVRYLKETARALRTEVWDWPQDFHANGRRYVIEGQVDIGNPAHDLPATVRSDAEAYAEEVRIRFENAAKELDKALARLESEHRYTAWWVEHYLQYARTEEARTGDAVLVDPLIERVRALAARGAIRDGQPIAAKELDLAQAVQLLIGGQARDGDFWLQRRESEDESQ
ncbi:hypothetical protein [Thioalkalivibrio sp. ALE23]|uniref:hypothetical protein n=1 Tax=Thioalkalivibrio sp. ALE23 TaxID=1265495 RepID=UPI0003709FDB|nr:hypothetical protein [Thioalkalivibrio sp. ALE23]